MGFKSRSTDASNEPSAPATKQKAPSSTNTGLHWFYLLFWNGCGALVIAGGVNFGIATGMYRHSSHPVQLWNINNNTLAGDAAVTIFVEMAVAWVIAAAMVTNDVRHAALGISPLAWRWRRTNPAPGSSLFQRAMHFYINREGMDLLQPSLTLSTRFRRLVGSAIRGLLLGVAAFFLWWPIGVGILAGIGRDVGGGIEHEYNHWPEPQIFKLIFGGTMGLFLVPVIAYLALLAMDDGDGNLKGQQALPATSNQTYDMHQAELPHTV